MTNELIGQTLAGKYRIDESLREDAFGTTFRATHTLMDKPVSIKVLNPALAVNAEIVNNFEREARMLSRLTHPHVLNVTDYGTDDERGYVFLVMENFHGRSLKDLIQSEGALPLGRSVRILQQVTDALASAHDAGIVHGALRTDNILLVDTKNGKDWVKVVDFEASNQQATENFYKSNQQQNAQAVFYLSPEQCSETAEADARSDIYALGIILYEMLAGRMPFTGESATDVMLKHAQEIPPSLLALRPDLPPAIEQVVQRALAKQPAQRFQSATDFSDALVRASEGAPTAFREEDTIVRPNFAAAAAAPIADSASDARWRTAFVVLAGISLLSAGLFFFTQGKRTTPGTEAADPSAQAVQPINPATGTAEQNLLDFSNITPNGSIDPSVIPSGPPAAAPPAGGGAGFPIDRIPQGIYPPGYIYPNSNSQFMEPDGAVIPNANRPANTANANVGNRNQNVNAANTRTPTNVNAAPSPTPTTQPAATPEATPAAKPTPAPATKPTPQRAPANKPPVPKPTEESTEKSTQSISERVSEQSSE